MCFLTIQRYLLVALLFTLSAVFCKAQDYVKQKKASYFTMSVPGALGTFPMSLNDSMAVTGYYLVSPTVAYGFLEDAAGIITTFKVGGSIWTEPVSINASGDITGFYETVPGVPHGFVRYANGRIITFNPPGNTFPGGVQAEPVSINAFGVVAGNYPFPNIASGGFARSRTGVFTTFSYAIGSSYPTVVTGLNASGTVVGFSSSLNYTLDAVSFLVNPDGFTTFFSVPLSETHNYETTIAESINGDGYVAGWYGVCADFCETKSGGGFVRSPHGVFTLFNAPGPIVALPESADFDGTSFPLPRRLSINQDRVITGSYTDANRAQHGFVRDADGVITSFDPPRGMQTTATSINDSGVIAGSFYFDWNAQTSIGFLRIPTP
jgi:hypothetical protein